MRLLLLGAVVRVLVQFAASACCCCCCLSLLCSSDTVFMVNDFIGCRRQNPNWDVYDVFGTCERGMVFAIE